MRNIVIIVFFLILSSCQKNPVNYTHGLAFLEKRQESLIIKESNKNDAVKILGNPIVKSHFEDNTWIYIERKITRGKLLDFGRNVTVKNNVLVLNFNRYGILKEKEFFDINDLNNIKFSKSKTEGISRDRDFIYGFLSSVRQKMYKNK